MYVLEWRASVDKLMDLKQNDMIREAECVAHGLKTHKYSTSSFVLGLNAIYVNCGATADCLSN